MDWYHSEDAPEPAEDEPRLMAAVLGPAFEASPGELELDVERVLGWDRDGTRVHCLGFADVYAVDVASGSLLWTVEHGLDHSWWDHHSIPAAFDPGGTRVAWYDAETLHIADAATGADAHVAEREDASLLVWSGGGRLAVGGPGGIRIFDQGGEAHRLPSVPVLEKAVVADMTGLAWSPDGQRLAVVTGDDAVEIWDLDGDPGRVASFDGPADAAAVYWGTALAVLSVERVLFCSPDGTPINEIEFADEPAGWSVAGKWGWPGEWA
ncbi:hypothetical protein AB0I28_17180 [Phytomonospora sp. NPDC050363]|uniref:hypothetical protein n=1 Tax=Phytomonospora sp. NPDC050363 TaxID=3155642 RepID=UPI0033C9BFB2